MTRLKLIDQIANDLKKDDNIVELSITKKWIDNHNVDEISLLSQKLHNIVKLDLSELSVLTLPPNKMTAIQMAFPEIYELVLNERENLVAYQAIQKIALGFQHLSKISVAQQTAASQSSASLFSPSSWGALFWSTDNQKHHHDTTRHLVDVGNINQGENNILEDWNRVDGSLLSINGQPFNTLINRDKNAKWFASIEALQSFLKSNLLYKLKAEQQDIALDFLMKTLHQGGLLNPVTAAVYSTCAKHPLHPVDARNILNGIPGQYREVKINATNTGCTIHESLTQNRLVYTISSGEKAGQYLLADQGYDFVFKVEARLNINWVNDPHNPRLNVEAMGSSFGSAEVKKLFDDGWFYQTWLDNLGYFSGNNTVNDENKEQNSMR